MSSLCHQDVKNFPFIAKVWIVVHVDFCDFMRWTDDGTCILIDMPRLQVYLNSSRSIFHINCNSMFFEQLEAYGFERHFSRNPTIKDFHIVFYHKDFQQNRMDLMSTIRKAIVVDPASVASCNESPLSCVEQHSPPARTHQELIHESRRSRMTGDLCFVAYESISPVIMQRMHASLVLAYQLQSDILSQKLEQVPVVQRSRRKCDGPMFNSMPNDSSSHEEVAMGMDAYENPLISSFFMDCWGSDCAGFYGGAKNEDLLAFFGDYKPQYVNGKVEVSKINDQGSDEEHSDPEDTDSPAVENFPDDNDANDQFFGDNDNDIHMGNDIDMSNDNDGSEQPLGPDENWNFDIAETQPESGIDEAATGFEMITHGDVDGSSEPQLGDENSEDVSSTLVDSSFYDQFRESMNVLYDNENAQ